MTFLYRTGLFFYAFILRLVAFLGVTKAQKWLDGRKQIWISLQQAFAQNQANVLWMHCASLGEFEQGRPIIEQLKKQYTTHKILLTFFSPSGYEVRQNYELADWVFYLPLDSHSNATRFLKITKPKLAIFVKYEYWYFYLKILHQQQIPTLLISAIFREKQMFFKWHGVFFRKMLHFFEQIFVQDSNSKLLLQNIGVQHVTVAGDTRLDRVLKIKQQQKTIDKIAQFCSNSTVVVSGSTWSPDETILAEVAKQNPNLKWIIAPHQIDEQHLQQIETKFDFTTTIRYSKETSNSELQQAKILIIDNIGLLSSLYAYAAIAYVGGGFGAGIHNILEAAVFEIPILFGPNHHKFKEAQDLIKCSVAFEIKSTQDMLLLIQQTQDPSFRTNISKNAQQYIEANKGASEVIMGYVNKVVMINY